VEEGSLGEVLLVQGETQVVALVLGNHLVDLVLETRLVEEGNPGLGSLPESLRLLARQEAENPPVQTPNQVLAHFCLNCLCYLDPCFPPPQSQGDHLFLCRTAVSCWLPIAVQ
jgi:hypothetical protein